MTDYAFETDVGLRNADMGWSGHVSNGRFVDLLDVARDRYFEQAHGYAPREFEHVIANLNLDYLREIRSLDPVTAAVGVDDVGRTSTTLAYELRHEDEAVARATTVVVHIDDVGSSAPIPDDLRHGLLGHAERQAPSV